MLTWRSDLPQLRQHSAEWMPDPGPTGSSAFQHRSPGEQLLHRPIRSKGSRHYQLRLQWRYRHKQRAARTQRPAGRRSRQRCQHFGGHFQRHRGIRLIDCDVHTGNEGIVCPFMEA